MERNRLIGPRAIDSRKIWGSGQTVPGRLRGRLVISIAPEAELHVGKQVFLVGRLSAAGRLGGDLYSIEPLRGSAPVGIVPSGALRLSHKLSGNIEAAIDTKGHLWPPLTFRGHMEAGVGTQGGLTVKRALSGDVHLVGALNGALFAPKMTRLAGGLTANVVMAGELTRFNMKLLSGDVRSNIRYAGDLHQGTFRNLTGHAEADIAVVGDLSVVPLPEYSLVAWGDNTYGQGNVPLGDNYTQVASGWWFGLALDVDGVVHAWGNNGQGQVTGRPSGTGHLSVAASATAAFAVQVDGSIIAWGNDNGGVVSSKPAGTGFKKVVGGRAHALALHDDGSIVAWGEDGLGQVSGKPAGAGFIDIAASADVSFAIDSSGVVYAWGAGTGSASSSNPLGTTVGHLAVAAQEKVGLAIDGGRQLSPWGFDGGENGFFVSNVPSGSDYIHIAIAGLASAATGAAIHGDGSIEVWGDNTYGQIANKPSGAGFGGIAAGARSFVALAPKG